MEEVHQYKPGSIKSIKLVNFMCHESFELSLGPKVNFIIGQNGSGKSALLTALVAALGGRASTTCRAKKATDFVMYGKKYAKVSITLHNYQKVFEKDQAFKADEYGKWITVEKTIYNDDASAKLALKNDKDKKVSERKAELDEMLEHFGILINNPICILNQDVSKTFLHSKKPEDKFELFMKATGLEQIESDYNSAENMHQRWGECNQSKTVAFKLLDNEYANCQEQARFLENRNKLESKLEDLGKLLVWAIARDNEAICKSVTETVENINRQIEGAKAEVERRESKIKKYDEDIQLFNTKLQSQKSLVDEAEKKLCDVRKEEMKVKTDRIAIRTSIEQSQSKIARYQKDMVSVEKSIEETKKQLFQQNDLDNNVEVRRLEIERLEKEIATEHARERSIRLHTDQLSTSMSSIRSDLHGANMRTSSLNNDLNQKYAILRRLKNGQHNELRKYGDFIVKVVEEINVFDQQGRFKHKPLGPLGYFLKLKNPEIAGPLEIHLGRNTHAFICDNHQDRATLNNVFKRISSSSPDFKHPMIITRPFCKRHDVSRYKAKHSEYKTLLDYLEIEHDAIYNVVVDRTSLESVLYISDYQQAEQIMIDPRLVPENTRCAYTRDCATMFPGSEKTGYRSFARNNRNNLVLFVSGNASHIRDVELEVESLKSDIRDAENRAKHIQDSLTAQRKEYDENNLEVRKVLASVREKEEKLLNLKSIVSVEPQELQALEEEMANLRASIGTEEVKIEKFRESLRALDTNLADIAKEKEGCKELLKTYEKESKDTIKIIDDTKNSKLESAPVIKQQTIVINHRTKDKEEETRKLDAAIEKLARSKQLIPESWEKPKHLDKTEVIEEESRKIKVQLQADADEERDPEEVLAHLKRRMKEIEDSRGLKEMNLNNHSLASKSLNNRQAGFLQLRKNTINSVASTFSSVMRSMNMKGELRIYMDDVRINGEVVKKARTLEINIDTHYTPDPSKINFNSHNNESNNNENIGESRSQCNLPNETFTPSRSKRSRTTDKDTGNSGDNRMTDTRSLSGGERSFSTVAFVLALWHHCASPFKLLDEIDVFMDMVTRRISYNALIRFAQSSDELGQFIFFSPLDLPALDNSSSSVRILEMPTIVRKRPYTQVSITDEPPSSRARVAFSLQPFNVVE